MRTAILALASASALAQVQAETTNGLLERRELSGGTAVTASEAPFLVFLETNYGRHNETCLGTVISPSWIVTAAHCIDATGGRQITVRHISGYETRLFARPPHRADERRHITIHMHPDYAPEPRSWDEAGTDIALLRLPRPLRSSRLAPARLPTASEALTIQPGLTVRTIGKTSRNRAVRADWPIKAKPNGSVILLRTDPGSRYIEAGDSGGPSLTRIGGEWVLIALSTLTFGNTDRQKQQEFAATNISHHLEWIASLGVDGIEPPEPQPQQPSTPEPRPPGRITLTLQTENLSGLTCTVRTSDGSSSSFSGGNAEATFSWTTTGPFRRDVTIECQ